MKKLCSLLLAASLVSALPSSAQEQHFPAHFSYYDETQDCPGVAYEDSIYSPYLFPTFAIGLIAVVVIAIALCNTPGDNGHGSSSSSSSSSH